MVCVMSQWFSDPCVRLDRYIANVARALNEVRVLDEACRKVVDLARAYLEDSKYYREKGDCITGLVTISYAEGLLDSLRMIGGIEFSWCTSSLLDERRVVAAGSFDILHPGHIEFLKWASSLGTKLFVIVARDSTYRRIRGLDPVLDERSRLALVSSVRYVYQALLGDEEDFLKPIERIKPHVIALGPDQRVDEDQLVEELARRGLGGVEVIRLSKRVGSYSSSEIKQRILRVLKLNAEG